MTYAEAMKLFKTARSATDGKPIGNNTRLYLREGELAIRLHNTDVVTFYPDCRVKLDSWGWRTVTTKARINQYGPVGIYQRDWTWYVQHWVKLGRFGPEYIFTDGMMIGADGKITGAEKVKAKDKAVA